MKHLPQLLSKVDDKSFWAPVDTHHWYNRKKYVIENGKPVACFFSLLHPKHGHIVLTSQGYVFDSLPALTDCYTITVAYQGTPLYDLRDENEL